MTEPYGEPPKPQEWNSKQEQEQFNQVVAKVHAKCKQGDKPGALDEAKAWPELIPWVENYPFPQKQATPKVEAPPIVPPLLPAEN